MKFLTIAGKALFVDFFAFIDDAVLFVYLFEELPVHVFGHLEDFSYLSKLNYVASFSFVTFFNVLLEIVQDLIFNDF